MIATSGLEGIAVNIQIPRELRDYVQRKVESGEYSSEQDVLAHALALLQDEEKKLAELQSEIQKGIESGEPVPGDEVLSRLKDKHCKRISPGD